MRSKGIGTLIMKKIIEYSKTENCSIIQWQTPEFNEQAVKFYQKTGGDYKTKVRFILKQNS